MCPPRVSTGTTDWSMAVCSSPPPPPPEPLVCVAPPEPPPVCTMPGQTSYFTPTTPTPTTPGPTYTPTQVSFGHGSSSSQGTHGSSSSHGTHGTGGGHHSAAADLAHGTHGAHMAHQGLDLVEGVMHSSHGAHGAQSMGVGSGLVKAGGIALAPIVIIGGGAQMVSGFQQGGADGTYDVLQGGTGVVGGSATLIAAGGTGTVAAGAATVAPLAASAGVGLAVGRYGDETSRSLFSDGRGVSDRLDDAMWDADQAVGGGALGTAAAIGTGIVLLPGAGVLAVGSAAVGAGKAIGGAASDAWNYVFD